MRRNTKVLLVCLAPVCLAPFVALALFRASIQFGWTTHVATIDCGKGRSVEVRTPWWWEVNRPLMYTVRNGKDDLVCAPILFGAVPPDTGVGSLQFKYLESADGDCVAIVDDALPDEAVILLDFRHGWFWPSPLGEGPPDQEERTRKMLAKVQRSHPDGKVTLQR